MPPVITLNGASVVDIFVGTVYADAGATAQDDRDGNITNKIIVTGLPINTNLLGSYPVTYTVSDAAGNQAEPVARTVNVVNIPPPSDTMPPVITMLGVNPVSVTVGANYVDAGATALDDVDGNITNRITVASDQHQCGGKLLGDLYRLRRGRQPSCAGSQNGECCGGSN